MKKRIKIEKIIESKKDYYIAVDIGKRNCVVCITDKDGFILEETKYENTLQEAEKFASNLDKKYNNRKCRAVCESTANMCLKTYEAFEKHGIDVKLANPLKTKSIAEARIKTSNEIFSLIMEIDREEQRSSYEIQIALNEKCYKGHFDSIKNVKHVLTEIQKLYDQNDDARVRQKCIEIRKTAQKQLTELQNKTPEVIKNYFIKKNKIESLK